MPYRDCVIEEVQHRASKHGPYLSCRLRCGSEVIWAQVFDEEMQKVVQGVLDNAVIFKKPATACLDLRNSESTKQDGTPWVHVVGYEHPNQMRMF